MARHKNPPVESLLVDCALATGRGLGNRKVVQKAVDFWAKTYLKSFSDALNTNPNYKKDRPVVLMQALKLGLTARKIAGAKKTITKAIAKKASKIIAADPNCVPQPGSGKYCPPPV